MEDIIFFLMQLFKISIVYKILFTLLLMFVLLVIWYLTKKKSWELDENIKKLRARLWQEHQEAHYRLQYYLPLIPATVFLFKAKYQRYSLYLMYKYCCVGLSWPSSQASTFRCLDRFKHIRIGFSVYPLKNAYFVLLRSDWFVWIYSVNNIKILK